MQISINKPERLHDLVAALNDSGCVAVPETAHTLEVLCPWIESRDDAEQAHMELVFFLRAWSAQDPELQAALS